MFQMVNKRGFLAYNDQKIHFFLVVCVILCNFAAIFGRFLLFSINRHARPKTLLHG